MYMNRVKRELGLITEATVMACLAPVVHEALEILEKQVSVFVQKSLDGISVIGERGRR